MAVVRAVLFDLGGTLVLNWMSRRDARQLVRQRLRDAFGERTWLDPLLEGELRLVPPDVRTTLRQESQRWLERGLREAGADLGEVSVEEVRRALVVPLATVAHCTDAGPAVLAWCKSRSLRVGVVTNTLWRGTAEVTEDLRAWDLLGAVDVIVTSHDCGWRKPHPAIFERALGLLDVPAPAAVMVGDDRRADIGGASRLGMRAILYRPDGPAAADAAIEAAIPDALIRDIGELPSAVAPWIDAPE